MRHPGARLLAAASGCAAATAATTSWSHSAATDEGSSRRAARDAWRRRRRAWWTTSSRRQALVPRPRLHLIRFHGVLAPSSTTSAKQRARVVPQEPEPPTQATSPVEGEANCAHHRPVRLSWAELLQAGVRDRRGALPELRRLAEDHRGDPGADGDREDPHSSWAAGPGTLAGASRWVAAASGLTSPVFQCSCGLPPRATSINSARDFRGGSLFDAVKRRSRLQRP